MIIIINHYVYSSITLLFSVCINLKIFLNAIGGFVLLSLLIYAAFLNDLSWSWALSVVSCLLFKAAGVLLVVSFLQKDGKVYSK